MYRMIAVARFIIAVTRLIISPTLSPPFYIFIIPPIEWCVKFFHKNNGLNSRFSLLLSRYFCAF
nr:MAG TPA: hypothetical protein [Caudoviricetes sp.]